MPNKPTRDEVILALFKAVDGQSDAAMAGAMQVRMVRVALEIVQNTHYAYGRD